MATIAALVVFGLFSSVAIHGAALSSGLARASVIAGPTVAPSAPAPFSANAPGPLSVIGSTPVPATVSNPLVVRATIPTGGEPQFAAFDPTSQSVYVPNWASNNVSVIHGTTVVASITVGSIPFSTTYDPSNGFVYVVNDGSNNVTVLNGNTVVGNVPVGLNPQFAAYDPQNLEIYVSNSGSANVSVINGTTVHATISVGTTPSSPVVTGVAGGGGGWLPAEVSPSASPPVIYIPNTGSGNVTVIGGATGLVHLANIPVGSGPQFATFDTSNAWLYVPNSGSGTVSVLSSTAVLFTVHVGTDPWSASYEPTAAEVYVMNHGSANVSVIGGAGGNMIVATIPVGSGPEFLAKDPAPVSALLVPNTGSGTVSVISGHLVTSTLRAGSSPIFGTVDPTNGDVYVQNFGSANVTLIGPTPGFSVAFKAHGLPSGSLWSVAAGGPPVVKNNTTAGLSGTISYIEPGGNLSFAITPPSGFGVALVTGPHAPTQSLANITGPSTLVVLFGSLESVAFNETIVVGWAGMPSGTPWNVSLAPTAKGGPPAALGSTTGASIAFNLPAGAHYTFHIHKPSIYQVSPPHGALGVPHHPLTKVVKFRPFTAAVVFREHGLPSGMMWQVNVTGPVNVSLSGTTATLRFLLVNGSYTFAAENFSALHPHPSSGSFAVVVPHAAVIETVNYTSAPGHFAGGGFSDRGTPVAGSPVVSSSGVLRSGAPFRAGP